MNSTITLLSKKHGQLKAAVQAIVELSMTWLPDIKEKVGLENWLELVETLRGVTEGKVCYLCHRLVLVYSPERFS